MNHNIILHTKVDIKMKYEQNKDYNHDNNIIKKL